MPPLRDILRYSLIILVVMVPFLFSPQPAPDQQFCGTFYHIGRQAGFVINCDSYEYARVSVKPSCLFEPHSIRQSRPLFILAGSALGYTLYPLLSLFHFNIYYAHFAGYLLINLLLVFATLLLLDRLLTRFTSLSAIERSLIAILLLSNVVSKTFFWTAHQQMFIFLTPLLYIHVVLWLGTADRPRRNAILVVSLFIGLSMLVYGNFVLLVISFLAAMLWYRYDMRTALLSLALIALPSLVWILILRLNEVAYYNHEVSYYRQFIWVADAMQVSWPALVAKSEAYWQRYLFSFSSIYALFALLLMAGIIAAIRTRAVVLSTLPSVCLCLLLLVFVFLYLMGYYEERLPFTLAAPLAVLFAFYYDRGIKQLLPYAWILLMIAAVGWHLYNVTRYGPFS